MENFPQLKVGSNPATVNSSSQVQNRSRSSNCCSKANTDSGSGAAWTLCMNFSLGHPLFVFTHISITAYKRPWFDTFKEHWCHTFDTCWQFRGKLLGDLTFYDAHPPPPYIRLIPNNSFLSAMGNKILKCVLFIHLCSIVVDTQSLGTFAEEIRFICAWVWDGHCMCEIYL